MPDAGHVKHDPRPAAAYVFLLAIIVFIIYGSLFPFDFADQPLPLERFYAEYQLFGNLSDALDNFLLFVPLGIALHAAFRRPGARLAAAVLSVLVLALGIQLVQLYLPSRTASLSDAFWNTAGMGVGFLAASRVRHALHARLAASHASGRDAFAACLVVLWFFFESFPFVPTLDVGELREHVKSFVFAPPFEPMRLLQHWLAAALAGLALMRLGWLRRPVLGVFAMGALSLTLEVCVAYGNLRRETLLGIALGLATGCLAAQRFGRRTHDIALVLALGAFLITVLTPYRGQGFDAGFTWTPFSHLLWQGVLKEIPPSAFEALAIGVMLWAGRGRFRARPWLWSAMVMLSLAGLEWWRVAMAGYHGDTTTLVMAIVLAPAAMAVRSAGSGAMPAPPVAAAPPPTAAAYSAFVLVAASAAALTLAMWVLLQLPGIPYNLKKLFGDQVLTGAAVFSLALLWLGGGPWLVARTALRLDARGRHGALWVPLLLVGIALVSFVLVDLAAPEIMLDKIIGAPDLHRRILDENYWGEAWRSSLAAWPRGMLGTFERVVRYVALYSVFAIPLVLGLLGVPGHGRRPRVIVNCLCLLPFWLLAKYVVIDWAITDNITELVAEGGAVFLAAGIALFALNAVVLAAYAGRPRAFPALAALTVVLVCATWWLLNEGIETVVVNNGRLFSGLQFLLGENRTALLAAPALFARWCGVYLAGAAIVVTGALLAMRVLPAPLAAAGAAKLQGKVPR